MSFPWAKEYKPQNPLMQWVDDRLPLPRFVYNAIGAGYPVPRNLNYWWNFGVLSGVALTLFGRQSATSPSLDRIQPQHGYVSGNVRIVCHALNAGMGNWGEEALFAIVSAWVEFRSSRKSPRRSSEP